MGIPLLLGHVLAFGVEPANIANIFTSDALSLEEFAPVENRGIAPDFDHPPGKLEQLLVGLAPIPVEPAYFVVLAISVVIALLASSGFISGVQHRHTLAQKEGRQEIA